MGNVKFKPWVGRNYQKGFAGGIRVLVIGESHYCANPSDATSTITIDIIRDLFDPSSTFEPYKNTYTKFAKALSGIFGNMTALEKEKLWNSVAFYNYVQEPITGPRVQPTDAQFKSSEAAFCEVLAQLRPHLVIAWGKRLYSRLPGFGHQGGDIAGADGTKLETWVYPLEGGINARVIGIDHPSVGFSPEYWNYVINKMISTLDKPY